VSAVERPTDGPDSELAAIVDDLDDLHTEACSVAMRSEGSLIAATEELRDDVASIRDRLRAVLARPGLLTDPAIALVGTRDGARTYMAMADALGQIAEMVGLPSDVDEEDIIVSGVRRSLARSDAGRDLTAQDVREAICETHEYERIAGRLNAIARPDGSAS
jgi:hypothetical protein